jgi:hypothetical protein
MLFLTVGLGKPKAHASHMGSGGSPMKNSARVWRPRSRQSQQGNSLTCVSILPSRAHSRRLGKQLFI